MNVIMLVSRSPRQSAGVAAAGDESFGSLSLLQDEKFRAVIY